MHDIPEKEIRVDTYTSGFNNSLVKVTHLPTSTIAECSDYGSSVKNKREALKRLGKKLDIKSKT